MAVARAHGVDATYVDIGDGGDDRRTLEGIAAAMTPTTRVVAVSHVLWTTGAVLPVAAIAEIAHAGGASFVIDGAQSAGAIAIDLEATGADGYAIAGQKWLLGPEGTGALAVRPSLVERLTPGLGGCISLASFDGSGAATFQADARRFEWSGVHRPSVIGFARSISWLSMFVGLEWVYARGSSLARATRRPTGGHPRGRAAHPDPPDGGAGDLPDRRLASRGGLRGARSARLRDRPHHRQPRRDPCQRRLLQLGGGAGALRGDGRAHRVAHARDDPATPDADDPGRVSAPPVRRRSWAEIRWRQFRNAPRPVVRAVLSSLIVAVILATAYLVYDIALSRGAVLPGGDLRTLAVAVYVLLVLAIGSAVTYLVVPQPTGSGTVVASLGWSAALGFFAAVPIAYLVMVVAMQIVRPAFG